MDDKGIELPARGRGWHAGDDLEGKPGRETLRAPAQFTPGARTCDVTMRVEEGARSLRQDKWYRTFRFELKLSQVPFASHKSAPPPIAAATGEHADVTLESLEPMLSSRAPPRDYRVRLWIAPKDEAHTPQRIWLLKRVKAVDDAANVYVGAVGFQRLRWQADGSPARLGQWGWSVRPTCFGRRQGKPSKFELEAEIVAVDRFERTVTSSDLPMPEPGEFIDIMKRAEVTEAGGQFLLRRIGYFTEDELPLTMSDRRKETFRPPVGVAAVVQYVAPDQAPGGVVTGEVKSHFRCEAATDDQGRSLKERGQTTQTLDGDAFAEAPPAEGTWRTFLLVPPWPDSKKLNLTFRMSETLKSRIVETVKFRNVPIPVNLSTAP